MTTRPFLGARLEEGVMNLVNRRLRKRGWTESIIPYTGYGTPEQVRVLGRAVLRPAEPTTTLGLVAEAVLTRRGWRNFLLAPIPRAQVSVEVGGRRIAMRADRAGYLDVRMKQPGLPPGWGEVTITADGSNEQVPAPVVVVDADETFGIVSDIDDTVISTFLPRLFIAAWNTFVLTEQAREAVPGMARMYQQLLADHPGSPVIYVSTGAWNTYPFLLRFLGRHGFPRGPLLLTDWGPTNTGWFRSGPEHKRTALRELARDFPDITWLLIGDDGQHDPRLYAEFAELQPEHVRAIAIRELTLAEQVLAHGMPMVLEDEQDLQWTPDAAPEVRGADGDVLAPLLRGILTGTEARQT